MNEETEALMGKIFQALEQNAYETDQIKAILQACKEAGLKFVPDKFDLPKRDGEIVDAETRALYTFWLSGQVSTLVAINSQIKEIDNEPD